MDTEKMNQGKRIVTFGFSVEELLKCIYAESAWRALRDKDTMKRPAIITADNRKILNTMVQDAYVDICARLIGCISSYDFNSLPSGILTLSLAVAEQLPSIHDSMMQKRLERALVYNVLSACYFTGDNEYSIASEKYEKEYIRSINAVRATLAYQLSHPPLQIM